MEPAAVAQDQGTPTWSEASEASDFASVDVNQMSPAASHSVSAESPANTVAMEQQSTAKLADRLGGWLTGMSTVAGMNSLHLLRHRHSQPADICSVNICIMR